MLGHFGHQNIHQPHLQHILIFCKQWDFNAQDGHGDQCQVALDSKLDWPKQWLWWPVLLGNGFPIHDVSWWFYSFSTCWACPYLWIKTHSSTSLSWLGFGLGLRFPFRNHTRCFGSRFPFGNSFRSRICNFHDFIRSCQRFRPRDPLAPGGSSCFKNQSPFRSCCVISCELGIATSTGKPACPWLTIHVTSPETKSLFLSRFKI